MTEMHETGMKIPEHKNSLMTDPSLGLFIFKDTLD